MRDTRRVIDSPERMIEVIRENGIIPFFRCGVPGWSIEEMTAPGCWFTDEEDGGTLGPWDWKIEAVREGDIAYGKFLGGKAAFATVEWYRELMNWRRSIPKYRMALGEAYKAATNGEKDVVAFRHLGDVLDAGDEVMGYVLAHASEADAAEDYEAAPQTGR